MTATTPTIDEKALAELQQLAGIPHPPTQDTYWYRMAISGEGPHAFDWSDKPHRLVYDLCRILEARAAAEQESSPPAHPEDYDFVALLVSHDYKRTKWVVVPDGQSLDFDEDGATRRWLHPHLGNDWHLQGFAAWNRRAPLSALVAEPVAGVHIGPETLRQRYARVSAPSPAISDEAVERAAEAIDALWSEGQDRGPRFADTEREYQEHCRSTARTAIRAALEAGKV